MVLEWTDESYFALEGIENFSLFNYRLKSLQQMNHDDWLADAIAGREDFLQINDLADAEKLTTALRILEIRFRSLILREQDIPLAERIYRENLYKRNREMLELWLSLFYDAPKGEALERSYTYEPKGRGEFPRIFEHHTQPSRLQLLRLILGYFKAQGWISSYQLLPSGGYRAFPKQKKLIKTS